MEDYLEAIAMLEKNNKVARIKDISGLLNVRTPSVTVAMDNLAKNGLVVHQRYGYVELTPAGRKLAQGIEKTHKMLVKFLTEILNVNHNLAQEDACKIEHSLSPQTSKKLTKFVEFIESNLVFSGSDWLKSFDYYSKTGKLPKYKIKRTRQKTKP